MAAGKLFVVPLPIGNLDDITLRAIKVLEMVDVVAAEDTRHFYELSSALKIKTKKVFAYHDHNEMQSAQGLLSLLQQGQNIAIVSDAGTPGIADPGHSILKICYENQIVVEPLPGASSLTTALSACPIGGSTHIFYGFAPSKSSERQSLFNEAKLSEKRFVFFESPHRIIDHLKDAKNILGDGELYIAREISKKYGEYLLKNISEHIAYFEKNPPLGEFVLIYPAQAATRLSPTKVEEIISTELAKGRSSKEILEILKGQADLSRSECYDLIQKLKNQSKA